MTAYLVASYTIIDPDGYAPYPQAVAPTLAPFGGELIVADFESPKIEGEPHPVTIIVRFPSKQAAHDWHTSKAYRAIYHLRREHTNGTVTVAEGWVNPT